MSALPSTPKIPLWPLRYISSLDEAPIRILLALGDPELRQRVAAALQDDGHVVLDPEERPSRLEDVAAAPSRWQAEPPDVLISSMHAPGDGELQALSRLKRAGWPSPVLLLSATGPNELCLKAYRRGADLVLPAPLDGEELLIAVRALAPHRG
jgi:DNA-binding response OmpR family regulator